MEWKLTEEQARIIRYAIADKADQLFREHENRIFLCSPESASLLSQAIKEAIDELTAKDDEPICEGCEHYHHIVRSWFKDHATRQRIECALSDFKPGYCPEGRWGGEKREEKIDELA